MKLKKGVKRMLLILMIIIVIGAGVFLYFHFKGNSTPKQATVVNEIKEYGYRLKSNKSQAYKEMFYELEKILTEKQVDEEAYVKKVSQMFILDFYSLNDKTANTDVGGVDFVHSLARENFLEKAEDTIYKYVESNLYGTRKQALPTVDKVSIESVEPTEFTVGGKVDSKAYQVKVSWTYKEESDYQNEATLLFVHEGKVLALVEME